ncbi:hypothetical protein SAMN05421810_11075 [Amycolatopsis arida]|uniref:General stress protein 17M-like domain-containing protein n=1 Tax=Amycolatopsis arida TaxID=587909 RepID=A0A1I5ZRH7_9PSEU|nr:general stress protein [Amycolatopsis arida]TDX89308.1 hypothetical protein CLV69_11075 [Amycolatopsis arida]SFQ58983.1 hypothetical protein SAMN05421810_11075 [Amycolatopsis arida]
MSTPRPTTTPTPPRQVIASYGDYADAERAVDHLSDHDFPVERAMIVGRGLEMVEQITGRTTYLSAAGRGAVSGAVVGALIGWLFGLFDWVAPLIASLLLALYGAVFGAIIGAVVALVAHALSGGRRDFSSVPSFRAQSHDVLVDAEVADRAVALLREAEGPGPQRAG